MKHRHGRETRPTPLLPRGKKERRRVEFLGAAAITLFLLLIVGSFFAASLQKFALRSPSIAAVVSALLVELANGDRGTYGLASLDLNPRLVAVAQAKANDMAAKEYFAHVSPQGLDPWHWFKEEGYSYEHAGENLAVDFSDSGDVERAWMASPTHRDNILSARYTEIGIASAQGMYEGRPTTFVVQVFASPASSGNASLAVETVPEFVGGVLSEEAPPHAQVLGSSVPPIEHSEAKPTGMTEPGVAAALAEATSLGVPAWGYILGFPRDVLRYTYYILGLLIILALAIDTGLEFRSHHKKRAMKAGLLLACMAVLFVIADYAFFAEPVLAFALQ